MAAHQALLEGQDLSKMYYDDNRARPQNINVGDCVLLRVPSPPQRSVKKLHPRYIGPYKVLKITDSGSVLSVVPVHARHGTAHPRLVHKDRARLCESNYPNIHDLAELMMPFTTPESGVTGPGLESEAP